MNNQEKEIAKKYLLPERPFLQGMISLFDFSGDLKRDAFDQILTAQKNRKQQSAADAIREDWQTVGDSMRWAMGQVDATLREKYGNGR